MVNVRQELVDCVKALYSMGYTSSVSGNHSIRVGQKWMLITPSGIPRYNLGLADLIRMPITSTNIRKAKKKPSIEWKMHSEIYRKRNDIRAIVHTHSPYTIGISISDQFQHVIEEAKIVVGNPSVISHEPSGSDNLAKAVSNEFSAGSRVVIIKNHGVVAGGKDIHHARAIVESLEEWAKILTVARIFGGPRDLLDT